MNCTECHIGYCVLKGISDKNLLRDVSDSRYFKEYEPKQTIAFQNSIPSGMNFICRGAVKFHQTNILNREQILYFGRQGDVIGYRLHEDDKLNYSVTALTKVTVSYLDGAKAYEIIRANASFMKTLQKFMTDRIAYFQNKFSTYLHSTTIQRMAQAILEVDDTLKDYNGLNVLSRIELGELAGINNEQVARSVGKLKELGMVDATRTQLKILKKNELRKLAYDIQE
jgi:CRP-like cAMP-binding protein